jgi:hypothetical protein
VSGALPYWVLLVFAVLAANLPFMSERIFFAFKPKRPEGSKALGWRLAELILLYFVLGLFARALEASQGQVYPQGWEFYAATACLFIVLAYPGFVWRYMWKTRWKRRA